MEAPHVPSASHPAPCLADAMDALERLVERTGALLQQAVERAGTSHIVAAPGVAPNSHHHHPPIASLLIDGQGALEVCFPRAQRAAVPFSLFEGISAHTALAATTDTIDGARRFHSALLAASPFLAARAQPSKRFASLDFGGREMSYQSLASIAEAQVSLRLHHAVAPRHDLFWRAQGAPRALRLRQQVEETLTALGRLAPTPLHPFLVTDAHPQDAHGTAMEVHTANAADAWALARLLDAHRKQPLPSTSQGPGMARMPAWPHGARVWALPVDTQALDAPHANP